MRTITPGFLAVLLSAGAVAAADAPRFEARLVGHAALPAETVIAPPPDAPTALRSSGKFTGPAGARLATPPADGARPPFLGQPVQGFSGIASLDGGRFMVVTDNGFGLRANSADAMLAFHVVRPDFESGVVAVEKTVFLSDPAFAAPFPIAMEGSDSRYLTGADFDIESFQLVGGDIVLGDEFGPYVVVADAETGVLKQVRETLVDGAVLRSPDHVALRLPNPDGAPPAYRARRSRGFEGLAAAVDGSVLYPMLEGPLWDAEEQDYERVDGVEALRILEMDATTGAWTGRHWLYPLAADGHAIGDFTMIDATRGLVIERDGGQGHPDLACAADATEGCFKRPARFKRVYLIDLGAEPGEAVKKIAYIDLMDIADPDGVARLGSREDGRFAFPFVTIENAARVDETRIIVANDNNFPFSKGRDPAAPDNTEFILLEVGAFLEAQAK